MTDKEKIDLLVAACKAALGDELHRGLFTLGWQHGWRQERGTQTNTFQALADVAHKQLRAAIEAGEGKDEV